MSKLKREHAAIRSVLCIMVKVTSTHLCYCVWIAQSNKNKLRACVRVVVLFILLYIISGRICLFGVKEKMNNG